MVPQAGKYLKRGERGMIYRRDDNRKKEQSLVIWQKFLKCPVLTERISRCIQLCPPFPAERYACATCLG